MDEPQTKQECSPFKNLLEVCRGWVDYMNSDSVDSEYEERLVKDATKAIADAEAVTDEN